ncbi:hypothetical protein Pmani_036645 [Petrolisthes manimaculis]|uniref:Uncharacterized protein n=1 Tax=Petrolisthes manimaculis TaxID=1843537 RepID=A0AAE1NJQ2_9EUCA|nr:hypothetical protein Pmani_036645 [Petrolisthes manimaculis]
MQVFMRCTDREEGEREHGNEEEEGEQDEEKRSRISRNGLSEVGTAMRKMKGMKEKKRGKLRKVYIQMKLQGKGKQTEMEMRRLVYGCHDVVDWNERREWLGMKKSTKRW